MKIAKEKHKVNIVCQDGSLIKGFIHIAPGMRIIDSMNNLEENFIAVTDVEFYNIKEIHSFKLLGEIRKKKDMVILNKATIKLLEEFKS